MSLWRLRAFLLIVIKCQSLVVWQNLGKVAQIGSPEAMQAELEIGWKEIEPLETELTSRIDRARIPLEWTVFEDDSGVSVRVKSLPSGSSSGYSSRRGHIFLKALHGSVQCVELDIDAEEDNDGCIQDGFITTGGEDDCVCRGGICPRRRGCKFWVEHMARKAAIKLRGVRRPSELLTDVSQFRLFKSDSSGPYELSSVNGAAAYLEVLVPDEMEGVEHEEIALDTTHYHLLEALEDRQGMRVQLMSTVPPGVATPSFMGKLSL